MSATSRGTSSARTIASETTRGAEHAGLKELAAAQKLQRKTISPTGRRWCEQDLFIRNNRRANEAVQFGKFFVQISVAAFE